MPAPVVMLNCYGFSIFFIYLLLVKPIQGTRATQGRGLLRLLSGNNQQKNFYHMAQCIKVLVD